MRPRRPLLLAIAVAAAAAALLGVGCGGGGGGANSAVEAEKTADVEILNVARGREMTIVAAYERGLPLTRGRDRALVEELRAQAQEHLDALTKSVRGLGGRPKAKPKKSTSRASSRLRTFSLSPTGSAAPR